MKCKYEGNGVWEGKCIGTKEVDPCKGYEKCKSYRPDCQTNADRIRAMSDEELAWELMAWRMETYAKFNGIESTYPDTQEKIYNWLLTPAEGEQHG